MSESCRWVVTKLPASPPVEVRLLADSLPPPQWQSSARRTSAPPAGREGRQQHQYSQHTHMHTQRQFGRGGRRIGSMGAARRPLPLRSALGPARRPCRSACLWSLRCAMPAALSRPRPPQLTCQPPRIGMMIHRLCRSVGHGRGGAAAAGSGSATRSLQFQTPPPRRLLAAVFVDPVRRDCATRMCSCFRVAMRAGTRWCASSGGGQCAAAEDGAFGFGCGWPTARRENQEKNKKKL